MIATITLFASLLTGVGTITGWYEAGHTSQAELAAAEARIQVLITNNQNTIKTNDDRSFCATLAVRISIIEDQVWQLEQTEPNGQRIREKRRELEDLETQYDTKNCAIILAR